MRSQLGQHTRLELDRACPKIAARVMSRVSWLKSAYRSRVRPADGAHRSEIICFVHACIAPAYFATCTHSGGPCVCGGPVTRHRHHCWAADDTSPRGLACVWQEDCRGIEDQDNIVCRSGLLYTCGAVTVAGCDVVAEFAVMARHAACKAVLCCGRACAACSAIHPPYNCMVLRSACLLLPRCLPGARHVQA